MRFAWVLIEVWLGGADGGLHICGGWRQVQLGWLSIEVRLDRGPSLLQLQCGAPPFIFLPIKFLLYSKLPGMQ